MFRENVEILENILICICRAFETESPEANDFIKILVVESSLETSMFENFHKLRGNFLDFRC